eukprot:1394941-Amorphochlora_amoeboformis.AAC.3
MRSMSKGQGQLGLGVRRFDTLVKAVVMVVEDEEGVIPFVSPIRLAREQTTGSVTITRTPGLKWRVRGARAKN